MKNLVSRLRRKKREHEVVGQQLEHISKTTAELERRVLYLERQVEVMRRSYAA